MTDPTWGDNGKGKIVDELAAKAEMVIRYNGGPNAGHTVVNRGGEFKLHLMPSGIFHPAALCILADTVVIDPTILIGEIKALQKAGIKINKKRLLISKNAHLIMPWHRRRDALRETARGGKKIGTTGRGIGPTYADRTERVGLRMGDLLAGNFKKLFETELAWQESLTRLMSGERNKKQFDKKTILKELMTARKVLAPLITDVMFVIDEYFHAGRRILGEAGQGMLLDLDRGTYPYVTSSHPGIAGFNIATGISPRAVNRVIGVTKAYTTRVGEGPMPTELLDKTGEKIREVGHEYGATTGRPRRCGWLDILVTRYGAISAGIDALALTKLDIFDDFDRIGVCVAYKVDGKTYKRLPSADIQFLNSAKPIIEYVDGWKRSTTKAKSFSDLPKKARTFVQTVEKLIGLPIDIVSVGPARKQTIFR